MKPMSYVIMLAAATASGSWLFAAEPREPAAEEPAVSTPATAPDETTEAPQNASEDASDAAPAATDDEAAQTGNTPSQPSAADKGAAAQGSPQRFIPSEQVRADFDVSFPIDI